MGVIEDLETQVTELRTAIMWLCGSRLQGHDWEQVPEYEGRRWYNYAKMKEMDAANAEIAAYNKGRKTGRKRPTYYEAEVDCDKCKLCGVFRSEWAEMGGA